MMSTMNRTNDDWLTDLRTPGAVCDAALTDLRDILMRGLRYGLVGQVNTSGPEFEPLADDFAQEALLKILDNLDTFQGRSKFTTWAHKIAVRVALSELRRKRWQNVSLDDLLDTAGDSRMMADTAPGPERAVEQADLAAHLQRIINEELTDKQRRAMVATRIHGMPIEEVARQMGMKRNALYKLLHDARLRLKRRMAQEGLTPEDVLATFEM